MGAIRIVDVFVLIFSIEIFHNLYTILRFMLNNNITPGLNARNLAFLLIFTVVAETIYLVNFLNNDFAPNIPVLLSYGLLVKGLILFRAKYG